MRERTVRTRLEVVFLRVLLRDFHVAGGHARLGNPTTACRLAATEIFEVPYCKEICLQYSPRARPWRRPTRTFSILLESTRQGKVLTHSSRSSLLQPWNSRIYF